MTEYLAYSIYAYIASAVSWRIEKLYKTQNNEKQLRVWFIWITYHFLKLVNLSEGYK